MKKIICIVIALLTVLSVCSCSGGVSVGIHALRLDNQVENLFLWDSKVLGYDIASHTETVTYKDRAGADIFTAEYYYEEAQRLYSNDAMYNIRETIGDYTLYAYEGSVYTETEKGITVVLLFGRTYQDFCKLYLQDSFSLDGEVLTQKNSSKENEKLIMEYHTTLTPQQASKLGSFGIDGTETVHTRYTILDKKLFESVEYSIIDGKEQYLFAVRDFENAKEKKTGVFDPVSSLAPSVFVDIVFPENENKGRHFVVPAGVYIGIDTADETYEFFSDEACTVPYVYDAQVVSESIVIYAREKT